LSTLGKRSFSLPIKGLAFHYQKSLEMKMESGHFQDRSTSFT
jgi:hypothetical protein